VSWIAPRIASRTGAAHLRRGIPCQDCSGWVRIDGGSAGPAWAMAVADGHGSARHRRSRDGSRLACEVALDEIAAWCADGEATAWQELAERIVGGWQERVGRHGQEKPERAGEPFTPVLYGTTLGLVLLTPRWWAHTGLGDWDLVRVDADGRARLLSEESRDGTGGGGSGSEATASLCLADASLRFAERTEVHALAPDAPPFALLLSTDGVRKSCGSDADFLTLAAYLAAPHESAPGPLDADLDRISNEGCGDDVSVAIARWGMGGLGEPRCAPPLEGGIRLCQPRRFEPPPPRRLAPETQPRSRWGRMVWVVALLLLLVISYAGSAWLVKRFPAGSGGGFDLRSTQP
jgi:hypothetical protein